MMESFCDKTLHVEGHQAKGEKENQGNSKNQRDVFDM